MTSSDAKCVSGDPSTLIKRRRRQVRITRAVLAGASLASVAANEGVKDERIRQIVRLTCRELGKSARSSGTPSPSTDHRLASFRAHREFWLSQLAQLERAWKLSR